MRRSSISLAALLYGVRCAQESPVLHVVAELAWAFLAVFPAALLHGVLKETVACCCCVFRLGVSVDPPRFPVARHVQRKLLRAVAKLVWACLVILLAALLLGMFKEAVACCCRARLGMSGDPPRGSVGRCAEESCSVSLQSSP